MCNLKACYVKAGASEIQRIWGCRGEPIYTSTLFSSLTPVNLLWSSFQCELYSQGDGFFLLIVLRIFHYMFVYGCPSLGVCVCVLCVLCVLCVCVYTACIVCMVCVYKCVCTHVVWVWELNFTAVSRDVYSAFEARSDTPELILCLSPWLCTGLHTFPTSCQACSPPTAFPFAVLICLWHSCSLCFPPAWTILPSAICIAYSHHLFRPLWNIISNTPSSSFKVATFPLGPLLWFVFLGCT